MPRKIVSNRDPKFTSAFWRHLLKMGGTKLRLSTAFHLQMDGVVMPVIGVLIQYLRNLVSADQQYWVAFVGQSEFCCNVTMHSVTIW